ncbi:MAG TPA: hypothetical protein VJU34_09710 [Phenylobacterium sp.]|nr:hypothetical protein [Phenylobacterium sp.]
MDLKPGSRWKSAVCDVEVVLVRPPSSGDVLQCGGAAMIPHGGARSSDLSLAPGRDGGSQAGKRYTDEATGMELLCTKTGQGTLSLDGRPVALKEAKKLPSSD